MGVDPSGAQRIRTALPAMALVLYVLAYYPALRMPFRVEEFDAYYHFATAPFNLFSAGDWIEMAFWTPFHDFRMLPLAYLWNFVTFKAIGPSTVGFMLLNVALDLLNAVLLARWVSLRLGRSISHGWIAAAFFLMFPSKHEIVLWVWFTYKTAHNVLLLGSLIFFEKFFRSHGRAHLAWALVLMFLSWFFYEISLPLGFVIPVGMFLFGRFSRQEVLRTSAIIAIPYAAYGVLYLLAKRYIPDIYGNAVPILRSGWVDAVWPTIRNWVWHGMFLANTGLPVYADKDLLGDTLAFVVKPTMVFILLVVTCWTSFMVLLRWREAPWRNLAYLLCLMFVFNILVALGRAATNGPLYLAHMGMYQYPAAFLIAAALGMLVETSLAAAAPARSRLLVAATAICLMLLWSSSAVAVRSYVQAQAPLVEILQEVKQRCAVPGARVAAADYRLPFSPNTFVVPVEDHSFHALALMYGDCVSRPGPEEQGSAIFRQAPSIPKRASAVFADSIELLGYDMPASVRPGDVFTMKMFFRVLQKPLVRYDVFVHFQDTSVKFHGDHEFFSGRFHSPYWTAGDYIRDVTEVRAGDATTPSGTYAVWVGLFAPHPYWRNAKVVSGKHDADHRVFLGNIQVRQ